MISYALVGTNDIAKASAFYDALMPELGAQRLFVNSIGAVYYGLGFDKPFFGVTPPYDGNPACVGNGTMISLTARDKAQVDSFYAKALSLGGTDEGAPGPRGPEESNVYAAYFRDLDGNKLAIFKMGA